VYDTFGFACYCRRESGFLQKGGLACAAYSCEGDMRLKKLLINGKKSTLNEWTIRHLKYPVLVK
jgi:hypothetical protein